MKFIQKKSLIISLLIAIFIAAASLLYTYLMQIGVDEGYEPVQPIHFSHKIHAGDNQIACQYCHAGARQGRVAGVPALRTCMGCHKVISQYEGVEDTTKGYTKAFYTAEIKKLYKAVGWDEQRFRYTDKTDEFTWVRIHNLPDFTYFNHSQHVQVAKIDCQQCHGEVQQMERMQQHAPLTMGWCVECHRKTMPTQSAYYTQYEQVHKELAKKMKVAKLTVAQIGGLECAKCHY